MSHFVCIVVGDDWESQLRPFCEHSNDEDNPDYMEFKDCTDEIEKDWATGGSIAWYADCAFRDTEVEAPIQDSNHKDVWAITTKDDFTNLFRVGGLEPGSKIKMYRGEGEDLEELYGKVIQVEELSKKKYRIIFKFIAAPGNVLFKDKYKSIDEFAQTYHGYRQDDQGCWGYYHNPRAKWDWYELGGRWGGYLKLKEVKLLPEDENRVLENGFTLGEIQNLVRLMQTNKEKFYETVEKYGLKNKDVVRCVMRYALHIYPSGYKHGGLDVFTNMAISNGETTIEEVMEKRIGYCDQTIKEYIDVAGMEAPQRERAEKTWDEFHTRGYAKLMADVPKPSQETPFRIAYEKFPEEMKEWGNQTLGFMHGYDEFNRLATMSREEYVECASVWAPFALLWGGRWFEAGQMGWWGISTNHDEQWKGSFRELWKAIPDDALISTVDCHI